MKKEYLPLGSVIMLHGIDNMAFCIVGYNYKKDNKVYDYCCSFFPWGIEEKLIFPVNIYEISGVCFIGYIDEKVARTLDELKRIEKK